MKMCTISQGPVAGGWSDIPVKGQPLDLVLRNGPKLNLIQL
jgi:hypothetical protein